MCIRFSGGIPEGYTIDFSLMTDSGSAASALGERGGR